MRRDDLIGGAIGIVVAATLLALVLLVGGQVLGWLKSGLWTEFPISRAIGLTGHEPPITDWKGLQKIIDLGLSAHVGFLVALIGLITGWGLYSFLERITRPLPPRR
jgi:hypothetical protein